MPSDPLTIQVEIPLPPNENRIGRFSVHEDVIYRRWKVLATLFERMVVVQVNRNFDTRSFDYIALCEDFDVVPEGHIAPEYRFIMLWQNDQPIFECERVN